MLMTFLGKPDERFPDLITGQVYRVKTHKGLTVLIEDPHGFKYYCPYDSLESFLRNWEPLKEVGENSYCINVYEGVTLNMDQCHNGFACDKCGNVIEDYEHYSVKGTFNYCSKCGRKVLKWTI